MAILATRFNSNSEEKAKPNRNWPKVAVNGPSIGIARESIASIDNKARLLNQDQSEQS